MLPQRLLRFNYEACQQCAYLSYDFAQSDAHHAAINRMVPANIELHSMPPEAERLAPQLRGFGYVVVEEQIALVDQRTRKIELVFPRWGE